MALFRRNRDLAATSAPPETKLGRGDVIPADSFGNRLRTGSNVALDRATQIYRKNPKMIGGLAILAGAALLNRMRAR